MEADVFSKDEVMRGQEAGIAAIGGGKRHRVGRHGKGGRNRAMSPTNYTPIQVVLMADPWIESDISKSNVSVDSDNKCPIMH